MNRGSWDPRCNSVSVVRSSLGVDLRHFMQTSEDARFFVRNRELHHFAAAKFSIANCLHETIDATTIESGDVEPALSGLDRPERRLHLRPIDLVVELDHVILRNTQLQEALFAGGAPL